MLTIFDELLKYRRRLTGNGGAISWLSGIGKDPFGPSQLLTRPAGEPHRAEHPQLQEHVTRSALHHHPQRAHDGPRYVQAKYPLRRIWASLIVGLDSLLDSWGKILKKLKKRRLRESPQKPRIGSLRQRERIPGEHNVGEPASRNHGDRGGGIRDRGSHVRIHMGPSMMNHVLSLR